MSEKSIPRQQAALVRGAKTNRWNPAISLGLALLGNSLRPGQEEHTMRETEVQIGNSGYKGVAGSVSKGPRSGRGIMRLVDGSEFVIWLRETVRSSTLRIACASICLLVLGNVGCGHSALRVIRVKAPLSDSPELSACRGNKISEDCSLPGIPFYAVNYRCVHTSVWIQPVYQVSLVIKSKDGKITKLFSPKTFTLGEFRSSEVQGFLSEASVSGSAQREKEIEDAWNSLRPSPDPYYVDEDTIDTSDRVYLASNSISAERYVDTQSVLFLNTEKPLAGSATATASLNADGTLGSATSTEESKTFATVAGLFPVSEIIKSAAAFGIEAEAITYDFQVSIKTDFYRHIHSAPVPGLPPCGVPSGKGDVVKFGNITVEHAGDTKPASVPANEAAKKPKENP